MQNDKYLIVGLGNPGEEYVKTRHNLGFRVVRSLAERKGSPFKSKRDVKGEVALVQSGEKQLILLLPKTYMNESGRSVRKAAHYYKVDLEKICVVCDDVALPFGKIRIRTEGSPGGHNGLKSIEQSLATRAYPRVRVGVGDRLYGDLSDHVLGRFSKEEEELLPEVVDSALGMIEAWIEKQSIEET